VSEEARSVLYGLNTFTMIISGDRTLLLGSFAETNHMPFQTKPSLPFIKNWQIALWPNESYMLDRADAHHYDALLSACSEIAKTPGLQTLKLSIPCLCLQPGTGVCKCSNRVNGECHCLDEEDIGDLHDMFLNILIPFDQLRFEGKVQLGATHKPAEQLWSNKHLARPSRFPRSENKHGYIQLSKYPHQKCQDPRCVSFAASFGPAMATLMGKTTPNILTKDQLEWLDLKKRVAETMNYHRRGGNGVPEPNISLNDLWDALDSGESEYFAKEKRRVYEQLRAHAFHTDSRYYLLSGRAGWR
ncbi:MAG: hypothetical protein L6R42_007963, partial [Xanthoria sp. 1 TBL-2021]